jgi:hypothetical protein
MLIHTPWRYVTGHWYGKHGLFWSFWINLVLIRVLLFVSQEWLAPEEGNDYRDSRFLVFGLVFVLHGALFVWQAIGVIRASEAHLRGSGAMAPVWGAQLGLVLIFFWVINYAHGAWQMTLPIPDNRKLQSEMEAARAAKYSIIPSSDERSLAISGSLELGISRHLKDQLKAYPKVEQIVLASTGGNIYEARGLSKLIAMRGLNTLVTTECSSACTTVFIGGANRLLAAGGKLGFHQYRIDADYAVLNADPLMEQNRDRAVFLSSGVEVWFLDKMFDSHASEMWYPAVSELIEANVVTDHTP